MANTRGMIVAELKRQRAGIATELAELDALIRRFGGAAPAPNGAKRGPKPGKRTLTPEQIARMQAGRKAAKEKKAAGTETATEGASLSAAATE
jgi:hypothetical protein